MFLMTYVHKCIEASYRPWYSIKQIIDCTSHFEAVLFTKHRNTLMEWITLRMITGARVILILKLSRTSKKLMELISKSDGKWCLPKMGFIRSYTVFICQLWLLYWLFLFSNKVHFFQSSCWIPQDYVKSPIIFLKLRAW